MGEGEGEGERGKEVLLKEVPWVERGRGRGSVLVGGREGGKGCR